MSVFYKLFIVFRSFGNWIDPVSAFRQAIENKSFDIVFDNRWIDVAVETVAFDFFIQCGFFDPQNLGSGFLIAVSNAEGLTNDLFLEMVEK